MAKDVQEDYELVPHSRVEDLEKEVMRLKNDPIGSSATGSELLKEIKDLNVNIKGLLNLFKDAVDQLKLEEKDSQTFSKSVEPLLEKVDTLIDQNKKIAKGIIAVADMVKENVSQSSAEHELMRPVQSFEPKPVQTQFSEYHEMQAFSPEPQSMRGMPPMGGMAPPPMNPPSGRNPPPPPMPPPPIGQAGKMRLTPA